MCSIAGLIFKNNKNIEYKKLIIDRLLLNGSDRGKDATGICLINSKTNDILIYKNNKNAIDFIKDKRYINFLDKNLKDCNIALLHNRATTQGTQKNIKNNHPILNKKNNSVLIHNGMVYNYNELKKQFKLKLDGYVDSEIIIKLYDLLRGDFQKMINVIEGDITFSLYHNNNLFLYKDSNPLTLCYDKKNDVIIFSSKKEFIKNSLTNKKDYFGLFIQYINKKDLIYRKVENDELINFKFNGNDFIVNITEISKEIYNNYPKNLIIKSKIDKSLDDFDDNEDYIKSKRIDYFKDYGYYYSDYDDYKNLFNH
tara:strand:- start:1265 stop:2197 length:933 start_codon:yes stop_codon:yes gene_type:complete